MIASSDGRWTLPPGAEHPVLQRVFAYWVSKAPPGLLPGRQHIDPIELQPVLPHIILVDVERTADGELRFKGRLAGTAISEAYGVDLTGRYLDIKRFPSVGERLHRLVEDKQPAYTTEEVFPGRAQYKIFRRLALPLAADGVTVDMILACGVFDPAPKTEPPPLPPRLFAL